MALSVLPSGEVVIPPTPSGGYVSTLVSNVSDQKGCTFKYDMNLKGQDTLLRSAGVIGPMVVNEQDMVLPYVDGIVRADRPVAAYTRVFTLSIIGEDMHIRTAFSDPGSYTMVAGVVHYVMRKQDASGAIPTIVPTIESCPNKPWEGVWQVTSQASGLRVFSDNGAVDRSSAGIAFGVGSPRKLLMNITELKNCMFKQEMLYEGAPYALGAGQIYPTGSVLLVYSGLKSDLETSSRRRAAVPESSTGPVPPSALHGLETLSLEDGMLRSHSFGWAPDGSWAAANSYTWSKVQEPIDTNYDASALDLPPPSPAACPNTQIAGIWEEDTSSAPDELTVFRGNGPTMRKEKGSSSARVMYITNLVNCTFKMASHDSADSATRHEFGAGVIQSDGSIIGAYVLSGTAGQIPPEKPGYFSLSMSAGGVLSKRMWSYEGGEAAFVAARKFGRST